MLNLIIALALIIVPCSPAPEYFAQAEDDWARDRILEPDNFWRGGYVRDGFVWSGAGKGAGITVYVVDTGIADNGFIENLAPGFHSFGKNTLDCGKGHGTSVASLIAGAGYGVAEAATIVPVRVLNCSGGGTRAAILAGLKWIATNASPDTSVVNISFGGKADKAVDKAVGAISDLGIPVIIAAGNYGANAAKYSPSRMGCGDGLMVAVAASTWLDLPWTKSNYGDCVWLYAPGANVLAMGPTDERLVSGTSFSAPYVSGAIAAYAAENGVTTEEALNMVMEATSSSMTIAQRLKTTKALLQMFSGDEFAPDLCTDDWWMC
jgi:subtilisin family serine protease